MIKIRLALVTVTYLISHTSFSQKCFITIDSTKIWINTIGLENRKERQPVIVFESGHGTPMDHWDRILAGVSDLAPLITYDRPGIGESEPDNEMPTIKNVSNKLVKILKHLDVKPPYVLVGHSLGGAYVRGFAVYYPELLAGLVIIDPADFTEIRLNKRKPFLDIGITSEQVDTLFNKWNLEDVANKNKPSTIPKSVFEESEVLAQLRETDFKEISDSKLPNIPVHILTGGRYDTPPRFRIKELNDSLLFRAKMKNRIERWTDVVQSVDKGMLFYSGDAGHFVHFDDPELLISSIRIVLQDYEQLQENKKKK
ncbi:MAG: alpha/beta hydrolase [Saprospiraceae bacterium]|nr:alpha/beta hydrolase [Saprospiraceae bacterium]